MFPLSCLFLNSQFPPSSNCVEYMSKCSQGSSLIQHFLSQLPLLGPWAERLPGEGCVIPTEQGGLQCRAGPATPHRYPEPQRFRLCLGRTSYENATLQNILLFCFQDMNYVFKKEEEERRKIRGSVWCQSCLASSKHLIQQLSLSGIKALPHSLALCCLEPRSRQKGELLQPACPAPELRENKEVYKARSPRTRCQ